MPQLQYPQGIFQTLQWLTKQVKILISKVYTLEKVGRVIKIGTGTLTTGSLYYLSSTGVWTLADADAVVSSKGLLGIALGSSPTTNGLLIEGLITNAAFTQTAGDVLYVSPTAGGITSTAPSTSGQTVRVVGYMTSTANTIYFTPDPTWVTLA